MELQISNLHQNIFVNNNFILTAKTKLSQLKIEEIDYEYNNDIQIFGFTNVDQFDSILYENYLKMKSAKTIIEREDTFDIWRFKNSKNIYLIDYDPIYKLENFDILSNRVPITSTPSMSVNFQMKTKYKLNLAKIYKFAKKNTKGFEMTCEENENYDKNIFSNFKQNEKENKFFETALKKKKFFGFQPTHMVKTETLKNRVSVNIKDFDDINEKLVAVDDTLFNTYQNKINTKSTTNSRPAFVEELFKKYDYQDLDPWKKVQNRTKDKSLCLSVIKDIYNKITNIFN